VKLFKEIKGEALKMVDKNTDKQKIKDLKSIMDTLQFDHDNNFVVLN
jgi:hypothetical protein